MNKSLRLLVLSLVVCFPGTHTISASNSGRVYPQSETRTLTIQDAVRLALSQSPDLLLAEAQAEGAAEALRESRSLNRPQVVGGTGLAYNNGFPLSIEGSAPSIFQIGLSKAIFSKKNNNLIREAEEAEKARRLGVESARNELVSKTALVYYELHRARKVMELASERLDAARSRELLTEDLLEAGRVRPVDATQSRTATFSAQQQLLVAREQAFIAEAQIRNLTGLPDTISIRTVEPRIDDRMPELREETLCQKALERAPEILQAEATIRAREYHVEAERGEKLPQLDLVGQYALFSRSNNYDEYFNRFTRNNFLVGLSIQWPLFTGSRTGARVAQSRQEVSEARYRLQSVRSDIKLGIQRTLSALRIAQGSLELAHSEQAAAQENYEINEILLEGGRISTKDLEDSQLQLREKELARVDADQVLFQQKVEVLRVTGMIASVLTDDSSGARSNR
jgi:outer membrane protein